jgi:hypothetical protein
MTAGRVGERSAPADCERPPGPTQVSSVASRDERELVAKCVRHVIAGPGTLCGRHARNSRWLEGRPMREENLIVDGGKLAGAGAQAYTV